jgi:hypothetical protein
MRCPNDKHPDTWDLNTLRNDILTQFGARIDLQDISNMTRIELGDFILEKLKQKYQEKEDMVGSDVMRQTERIVMLQVIDNQWKDHLLSMDELKQGIGLRGHGQKDPLVEYKKESYELFTAMMDRVEDESVRFLYFPAGAQRRGPVVPYPETRTRMHRNGSRCGGEAERPRVHAAAEEEKKLAAKRQMEDFTRNIERKKDKELAGMQFGGDDSVGPKRWPRRQGRPQRSLPVRQRQEVQKVPRRGLENPLAHARGSVWPHRLTEPRPRGSGHSQRLFRTVFAIGCTPGAYPTHRAFIPNPEISLSSTTIPRAGSRHKKSAPQVDAGLQRVGLVLRVVAARLRGLLVAVRQIHVQQPIVRDGVARAERQDAGEFHAIEQVADHADAIRPVCGLLSLNRMPTLPERIEARIGPVHAGVLHHVAIVEAVEVDALAVHFGESIARVDSAVDVAGGIEGHGIRLVLEIH